MSGDLARLAAMHGVVLEYRDNFGKPHRASPETLRALLGAMGVDATSNAAVAAALAQSDSVPSGPRLPRLSVLRSDAKPWMLRVRLPERLASAPLTWLVASETGTEQSCAAPMASARRIDRVVADGGTSVVLDVPLPIDLAEGYHEVALLGEGKVARGRLA